MGAVKIFRVAVICMMIAVTQQLHAQNNLPKYEFTVNGFGGISTLNYKINGAELKKDLSGGGGLGFHYFFNDRWGLVTGVDAAFYKATLSAVAMKSGQLFYIDDGIIQRNFVADFTLNKFKETQNTWMLQIPLMLQWMQPLNAHGNTHMFLALGGRLGLSFSGDYRQSVQERLYTSLSDSEIWNPASIQLQSNGGFDSKGSLKFSPLNVIASIEAGVRWSLGVNTSLYTGAYLDYGLSNIIPSKSKDALYVPILSQNYGIAGDFRTSSILTAHRPDYGEVRTLPGLNPAVHWVRSEARYTDKVNTLAMGLKVKIAFGGPKKSKANTSAVVTKIVEKVVRDTVVKEVPVVVRDTVVREVIKEVPQEIKQSMMNLSNTLFEFDKWNLSGEAVTELNKVVKWLKDNPEIYVEIEGHTDNMGQIDYNQKLSEDRARSVHDYFVEHGVSASRLSFRGYGLTQPVADNTNAEGRRQNRRVELKIINN